jgi:hypothetical protein
LKISRHQPKAFPSDDQECLIVQFNDQNIFVDLVIESFWSPTNFGGHLT